MKTKKLFFTIAILAAIVLLSACSDSTKDEDITGLEKIEKEALKKSTLSQLSLTPSEIEGILFMREEEKLAHDVYEQLYADFGHKIFLNIMTSEQNHMDAMLRLITYYELDDSATGIPGQFNDEVLQVLYDDLMAGVTDLVSALEAGVTIEETDITDISGLIEETDVKNIVQVYSHLLSGSENHLKAFNKVLDKVEKKTQ